MVRDVQVEQRRSQETHKGTPLSKYLFMQRQSGLKPVMILKLAELQVLQEVPFTHVAQTGLQAGQAVLTPSS